MPQPSSSVLTSTRATVIPEPAAATPSIGANDASVTIRPLMLILAQARSEVRRMFLQRTCRP